MSCVDCGRVRAIAAYGLPGSLAELPSAPLADIEWAATLASATEQRVTGLLAQAAIDGAFAASAAQVEEAAAAHHAAMAGALMLERLLIETVTMLADAGVETRVLKGPAAAHLDYPDPAMRSFGDIDLLVRSADLPRTVDLLAAAGFQRRYPEPRRGFDKRFAKGVSLTGPRGLEVDLHRTLALGPFGLRIPVADLWESGTPFAVGGQKLLALRTDLRLVHACYHAALGHRVPRLVPLRDVAQLLLFGSIDQDAVRAVAAHWRGEAVLAYAIERAWAGLQVSDVLALSAWAEQYQPTADEDRELRCYQSPVESYAAKAAAAIHAIPHLRDKILYGLSLAFPNRDYLRGSRRLSRVRRGLRLLASPESERR